MAQEPFTLLATKSGMAGLTAELLGRVHDQVLAWGLPSCRLEHEARILHYRGPQGAVTVQADVSGILVVVGRASLGRRTASPEGGLSWDPAVDVGLLDRLSQELDREMAACGLRDERSGVRHGILRGRRLRVDRHFPHPGCCYYLHRAWRMQDLLSKFDRPELLAVVENSSGRRILCRAAEAEAILSVSLDDGSFKNPSVA